MRTEFLCISVLRKASGPSVKLFSCKIALTLTPTHPRSKAVVHVFFSPLSIAITSFGGERANRSTFRTFVRFALVWFYLFPLSLGVWEGLRLLILALPGLFSYLFSFIFCSPVGKIIKYCAVTDAIKQASVFFSSYFFWCFLYYFSF